MRARGINYDTGFRPGGRLSRERFDPEVVRREMRVIADDLHCTAVRVSGGDPGRLAVAARCAAEAGPEVWFAPFPSDLRPAKLLEVFEEEEGVDAAFWFTFAGYGLPHRPEPRLDLDLASYGVVRMAEDGAGWEPKEVFHALAEAYAR